MAHLLEPGNWNANALPVGTPWLIGTEIEFAPGHTAASSFHGALAKGGLTLINHRCRQESYILEEGFSPCCCNDNDRVLHVLFSLLELQRLWGQEAVPWDGTVLTGMLEERGNGDLDVEAAGERIQDMLGWDCVPGRSRFFRYPYSYFRCIDDPSCGLELQTPPLDLSDEYCLDSIHRACEIIREAGGEATASCGLHVHVNTQHLTQQEIANVIGWYRLLEPFLLLPTDFWRVSDNTYSQPWMRGMGFSSLNEICRMRRASSSIVEGESDFTSLFKFSNNLGTLVRHHNAVSTTSLSSLGTLEFRMREGTLDSDEIIQWLMFIQRFFYAAVCTPVPALDRFVPIAPDYKSISAFIRWMKFGRYDAGWYLRECKEGNKRSNLDHLKRRGADLAAAENDGVWRTKAPDSRVFGSVYYNTHEVITVPDGVSIERLRDRARSLLEGRRLGLVQLCTEGGISIGEIQTFINSDAEHIKQCQECKKVLVKTHEFLQQHGTDQTVWRQALSETQIEMEEV